MICTSTYQPTIYDEILTPIFILFSFLINITVKAVKDNLPLPEIYDTPFFFSYTVHAFYITLLTSCSLFKH